MKSRYVHFSSTLNNPLHSNTPQNVAFYTAIGAASAELLTLITLALSAIKSMRDEPELPTIQIHEKKDSSHVSHAWKPSRPKTWIQ